ncbi:unnamed protein product [Brassica rapa subsp. trilocularis]
MFFSIKALKNLELSVSLHVQCKPAIHLKLYKYRHAQFIFNLKSKRSFENVCVRCCRFPITPLKLYVWFPIHCCSAAFGTLEISTRTINSWESLYFSLMRSFPL